jgi:hypothetical protein
MTHFPQPHRHHRATRIQLANQVPATLRLGGGIRARGRIHSVSVTGGLLQLAQALEAGDFVEIAFQTQAGAVRGMAEMLPPRQVSTQTTLQAFRFVVLEDDDHGAIRSMVNSKLGGAVWFGNT